jgi:hypothetical protein
MSEDGMERFVDDRESSDDRGEITLRQTPLYDRGYWRRNSIHQHHIWFLDLFSGPGGVGHAVKRLLPFDHMWAGVDIEDYSDDYPGQFIQADLLDGNAPFNGLAADVCWVSFPCTAYSSLSPTAYGSREAALEENPRITDEGIRKLARDNGAHYIIENVPGATRSGDLEPNVRLNGLAFGKPYDCERHFETSFPCPSAYEEGEPEIVIETREDQGEATRRLAEAKGVPTSWSRQEIRSAIPREFVYWLLHHCPTDAISAPKPERAQQTLDETTRVAADGGRSVDTDIDRSEDGGRR